MAARRAMRFSATAGSSNIGGETNARATRARSARPASVTLSRTTSPVISAPAFPAALTREPRGGGADTRRCPLSSPAHVKPGHPGTRSLLIRWQAIQNGRNQVCGNRACSVTCHPVLLIPGRTGLPTL